MMVGKPPALPEEILMVGFGIKRSSKVLRYLPSARHKETALWSRSHQVAVTEPGYIPVVKRLAVYKRALSSN